ncbi:glycosyltransferase family 4 protein [Phenylobacterium soli]|uniref:Glycosyltransferase n=1 Tax=Phenylobacterium soli TaxID=2170551 RepID=A0A328ANK4_9CAUL|nr:glycosyltransferase family 4 protein [Phenylobacterium soli]RAK55044.1 hypothetical protein DJ017_11200 [Phenylobacterium soli]
MPRTVVINWGVASYYGWGVYGLNLALAWASDPEVRAACGYEIQANQIAVDALGRVALRPFLRRSADLQARLKPLAGTTAHVQGVALQSLNAAFQPMRVAHDVLLQGEANIGVTFFETAHIAPEALDRARAFDLVVTGSGWNEAALRAQGVENVRTVLQGIDPALFHPAPRRGFLSERFLVFSGGKLERRKGQDIALAAFKIFAERHPEALLVSAWHSPWPQVARTLDASGLAAPVVFAADGRVDVAAWAEASGVPRTQVLDVGLTPNAAMPQILREMDVALFTNRCEGGTNLVAMEAMACGVPAILSRNTGHLDLIEDGACYVLERQAALPGAEAGVGGVAGWGESDVEEAVAALEAAYRDREDARRRGARGAQLLSRLTWAETARRMKAAALDLSPASAG